FSDWRNHRLHRQDRLRWPRGEDSVARPFATAARLHADLAVDDALLRVVLALVTAQLAGLRAGLGGGERREVEGGLAREDLAGGQAQVGAIEAEANAAVHVARALLAEVGVGVGGAGLSAVEARSNALHADVEI